jgi:hypothetical protein
LDEALLPQEGVSFIKLFFRGNWAPSSGPCKST